MYIEGTQTMECGSMNGPCSICKTYAESASAYCCRQDVTDQKECSESQLRVIWTPKASIHTFDLKKSASSGHNKLKCIHLDEAIPPSVDDILGEEHAEILMLNADARYYVLIVDSGGISKNHFFKIAALA